MGAFIDAIGLLGTALGVINFAKSNLPGHHASGTTVEIKAGYYNDLNNGGGGIKDIYGFDNQNGYIGKSGGGHVNAGGTITKTLDQATPSLQGDFIDVTFTNDAVCVAWISVKMHDGSPGGGWTGDIGKQCGQSWYKNSQAAGEKKNGQTYRPHCTWFDGDHTNNIPSGGVKFRTRAYGNGSPNTINKGDGCKSTIFSNDNSVINGKPAKRDIVRPEWIEQALVVSELDDDVDSAEELCTSDTSYGPDFMAHGKFCDMGTKTLYPMCDSKSAAGCVELNNSTLSIRNPVQATQLFGLFKDYARTDVWTE